MGNFELLKGTQKFECSHLWLVLTLISQQLHIAKCDICQLVKSKTNNNSLQYQKLSVKTINSIEQIFAEIRLDWDFWEKCIDLSVQNGQAYIL